MMERMTWMKWCSRDALGDPLLRACKPASRGIWYDMLWLMDVAEPRRGYLSRNGEAYPDDQLCRALSVTDAELQDARQDLLSNGVPSIESGSGIWFNRRMVRDERRRQSSSRGGVTGGGNPALKVDEDAWLETLKVKYGKLGVDVAREQLKARMWLETNRSGCQFTRRYFINWLNKASSGMSVIGASGKQSGSSAGAAKSAPYRGSHNPRNDPPPKSKAPDPQAEEAAKKAGLEF